MDWTLTKQDSAAFKGIAIMAMLVHHLYCTTPRGIVPYDGILPWLGALGKVCVSMFLFISGYGLSASYAKEKKQGALASIKFVARRLVSFYMNYWVIFLIFVPITVYGFGRSFYDAYNTGGKVTILNGFLDILGMQNPPYNITWWFNRLIIILYIVFPILFWCIKKYPIPTLFASLLWMFFLEEDIWCYGMSFYQFAFITGILWHCMTTHHGLENKKWKMVIFKIRSILKKKTGYFL